MAAQGKRDKTHWLYIAVIIAVAILLPLSRWLALLVAAAALVAGLSLFAGPLFTHAEATTRELRDQQHYIRSILGDRPVIIPPEPQGNELLKEKGGTH